MEEQHEKASLQSIQPLKKYKRFAQEICTQFLHTPMLVQEKSISQLKAICNHILEKSHFWAQALF